jgi:hypothetical protein
LFFYGRSRTQAEIQDNDYGLRYDVVFVPASLLLGGHSVDEWIGECTHLLMSSFTVTKKVLRCIINCCYVISPEWLEKMTEREGLTDDWPPEAECVAQKLERRDREE